MLRAIGMTDPERRARQAGSERCVEWLIEQTKTAANPAGAIVKRLDRGERPPDGWQSRDAKLRAASERREREREQARSERVAERPSEPSAADIAAAELELIEQHAGIADRAVDELLADPDCPRVTRELDQRPRDERRRAPRIRAKVLNAIEVATGERPSAELVR